MANPRPTGRMRPLKHSNAALLQTLKNAILKQNRLENFGPQNGHFSKMWPSSRFGLAMADTNTLENLNIEKCYEEKKLVGFQKPLFGTPDIIPHPSLVSVFCSNFIKLKISLIEP
jgi:hypothetical protein